MKEPPEIAAKPLPLLSKRLEVISHPLQTQYEGRVLVYERDLCAFLCYVVQLLLLKVRSAKRSKIWEMLKRGTHESASASTYDNEVFREVGSIVRERVACIVRDGHIRRCRIDW